MYGLLLLVAIAIWIVVKRPAIDKETAKLNDAFADKIDKLWVIAQDALKDQKYLKAEKALLTILRVDQRNAAAYNRLGILYAKQKAYEDAIECFEIAQSLEPNASSLHNVGLIYFETDKLDKALLAFEQAIEMEAEVSSRHIAYAKVHQKMGNLKKAIISTKNALSIERTPQGLRVMADLLDENNQPEEAQEIRNELQILLTPKKVRSIGTTIRQRQPKITKAKPVLKPAAKAQMGSGIIRRQAPKPATTPRAQGLNVAPRAGSNNDIVSKPKPSIVRKRIQ